MKLSNLNVSHFAILIGLITMLCFASCTKDLDSHIPGFTPKIGVNSIFTTDTEWKVKIFKTSLIFDPIPQDFIDNAIVTITDIKSGVQFQLKYAENGIYVDEFDRKPSFGRRYQIDVVVEGYAPVTSYSVVPSPVDVQVDMVETIGDDFAKSFKVEVHDNPSEENFYILEFDVINRESQPIEVDEQEVYITVEGVVNNNLDKPKNLNIFVEDSDIGNTDDNIYSTVFDTNQIEAETPSENEQIKYLIKVRSVSKDLYFYLKSRDEYLRNNGNTSLDDPTPIHSNIENGTGIFGAFNEQVFEM